MFAVSNMKLLIISSLIWFAATTVRTCLGHPSAGAGPSLLRREEPIPDNGDTPPAEWEVVRDYRKTFQNADGGWAEGEEAARVCVKYFIRESLVKNVVRQISASFLQKRQSLTRLRNFGPPI